MDKKKGLWQKLKTFKHKEIIIAVLGVTIMLVIYFSTITPSNQSAESTASQLSYDFVTKLDAELTTAVRKASGDDTASVVIRWSGSEEIVIAYTTNETQNGSTRTPTLMQNQSGSEPIVLQRNYPLALSVAIVVKNGNDAKLKVDLVQMVSTLLEISPEKVAICSSK